MTIHQARLLKYAISYPGWHSFAKDRQTRHTVSQLVKHGLIEVVNDQFRLAIIKNYQRES